MGELLFPANHHRPPAPPQVAQRPDDQAPPRPGLTTAVPRTMLHLDDTHPIASPPRPQDALGLAERPDADERDRQHLLAEQLDAARVVGRPPEEQPRQQVERLADEPPPPAVALLLPLADDEVKAVAEGRPGQALRGAPLAVAGVEEDVPPSRRGVERLTRPGDAPVHRMPDYPDRVGVPPLERFEDLGAAVGARVVHQD